jgi:hypothetical protein
MSFVLGHVSIPKNRTVSSLFLLYEYDSLVLYAFAEGNVLSDYILTFLKIINSTLTDLVIILFKSTVRVYSPLPNIRNFALYLFLL